MNAEGNAVVCRRLCSFYLVSLALAWSVLQAIMHFSMVALQGLLRALDAGGDPTAPAGSVTSAADAAVTAAAAAAAATDHASVTLRGFAYQVRKCSLRYDTQPPYCHMKNMPCHSASAECHSASAECLAVMLQNRFCCCDAGCGCAGIKAARSAAGAHRRGSPLLCR